MREAGHVQVGLARPLVLLGLSPREEAFLASLEGRGSSISAAECRDYARVVDSLKAHGLLTQERREPALARALVRVRRVDAITSAVATALARANVGAISIVDARPAHPMGPFGPAAAGLSLAAALARSLKEIAPTLRIAGPSERASLEILRGHGALDLTIPRELSALDVPHLGIVTDEDGIDVGPLVAPGATPCEICLGIARTEIDPWWPRLALQLGGAGRDAGLRIPEAAALLAAGIAVSETVGALSGTQPTMLRVRVPFDGGAIKVVRLRPHPDCGCGAAGSVGDPEAARAAAFSSP